jgi:hypothetical protein|tara:strand:+ start:67 stop:534 length:468 start_codon:yes stop_codon:yes gene_type:complete
MALTWDITNVDLPQEILYEKNDEGEEHLNPITWAIIWSTIFLGFNELTEKNLNDWHRRMKQLEISGMGLLGERDSDVKRMPNLKELKLHIGLKTNGAMIKKGSAWNRELVRQVNLATDELVKKEKVELEEVENEIEEDVDENATVSFEDESEYNG